MRIPDPTGRIIEVPLSVGYTQFSSRRWRRVAELFGSASARATHLAGFAARSGLLRLASALERNPEPNPASVALVQELLSDGCGPLYNPNVLADDVRRAITRASAGI